MELAIIGIIVVLMLLIIGGVAYFLTKGNTDTKSDVKSDTKSDAVMPPSQTDVDAKLNAKMLSTQPTVSNYTNKSIKAMSGGRCFDVINGGLTDGVALQLYDCNNSLAQQFSYDPNTKAIKNTGSGKCMDADMNSGIIQQWNCANTGNQQWTMIDQNRFQVAADSSKCISIAGNGGQGDQLYLHSCADNLPTEHFSWV